LDEQGIRGDSILRSMFVYGLGEVEDFGRGEIEAEVELKEEMEMEMEMEVEKEKRMLWDIVLMMRADTRLWRAEKLSGMTS